MISVADSTVRFSLGCREALNVRSAGDAHEMPHESKILLVLEMRLMVFAGQKWGKMSDLTLALSLY